jgi:hypothetical protein
MSRNPLLPGRQTLTDSQVVAIIYDDSTNREAARIWGVTEGCISSLRSGKTGRTANRYFAAHIKRAAALHLKTLIDGAKRLYRQPSAGAMRRIDDLILNLDKRNSRRRTR